MSLLPSFALAGVNTDTIIEANKVDIPVDYEIDFNTGRLTGGIVEGVEAIKVWIWLALQIERYRFPIFHGSTELR